MLRALGWAAVGFAAAPVVEYAWHAWIAHSKHALPTRDTHLDHHKRASELVDVEGEIRENAGLLAKTVAGVTGALAPFVGLRRSLPFSAGLFAGYVAMNFYHEKMHARGPETRYEEWMWRFHWYHHAVDARKNFGFTNPALDFVFGTAVFPETVEIPAKLAPEWLREARRTVAGIKIRGAEAAA